VLGGVRLLDGGDDRVLDDDRDVLGAERRDVLGAERLDDEVLLEERLVDDDLDEELLGRLSLDVGRADLRSGARAPPASALWVWGPIGARGSAPASAKAAEVPSRASTTAIGRIESISPLSIRTSGTSVFGMYSVLCGSDGLFSPWVLTIS